VSDLPKMTQLSVADDAMCVTLADQTALCWGADHNGSLGHDLVSAGQCNGLSYDPVPKHVAGADAGLPVPLVADVHIGNGIGCLRATNGQVMCWGDNRKGGTGQGFPDNSTNAHAANVPALVAKTLVVHDQTACAVAGDKLLCWGDGEYGQLDTLSNVLACNNQVCRALPYVMPTTGVRDIALGFGTTAVITNDLSLLVWGFNATAQAGIAPADGRNQACTGGGCILQASPLVGGPALL
jgi:alpha-tubulin suppressor-like RCC1 family protein